jgi:hypothetical protein
MEELIKLQRRELYLLLMKDMRKMFGDTQLSHKGKGELMHNILALRACMEYASTIPKIVCPRGKLARKPGVQEVRLEDCVVNVPHLKTKNSIKVEDGRQEKHIHTSTQSVLRPPPRGDLGEGEREKALD